MNAQDQKRAILLSPNSKLLPTHASGVKEPAPKKKPIAALLDQTYGTQNAKNAVKNVKFPPVR